MGNAISSAITDAWLASHKRRVEKWLDGATEESVLHALTCTFFPSEEGYGGLPAARDARSYIEKTFDAYGSVDPNDKKRYWYEKDLENFLSTRFPGPALSASIPMIWRSFHFFAYFPFRRKPRRLDYSAFQRAIGFLAAEGSLRLGGNANGITMDRGRYPDDSPRATKHIWTMFKSFTNPSTPSNGCDSVETHEADLRDLEEDLMDVLALTQPDNLCIMPAPIEELRPHARRILIDSTPANYSSICRRDFQNLVKLILSIQLDKPEWGPHEPRFYTGRTMICPNIDLLQGAADTILRRITSSEVGDVDWQDFKDLLNRYLPDFPSQFRLIFTSFLPPVSTKDQTLNTPAPDSIIPVPYAQYLHLFLHPPLAHPKRHVFEDFARNESHYALQSTETFYSASPPTLNTASLIAALRPIKTGTLLLITGETIAADTAHSPKRAAIGACMPTPWDIDRERSFRASPPQKLHRYTPDHALFQLEPSLEILRPESDDAWIMDLIHFNINDDDNAKNGKKGGLRFGAEGGSGLYVDFDSGIATLSNITTITSKNDTDTDQTTPSEKISNPINTYHSSANADTTTTTNWTTSIRIANLSLYDLGGHATAPFEDQLVPQPQLRSASPPVSYRAVGFNQGAGPIEKPSAPQVGEEELKKRIEGFGSGG